MLSQLTTPDLRLLRVFRVVARHHGLVAAQTDLNASLSTISLQIKKLEDRLGIRLCERGKTGFRLTTQGEAVLRATERLFSGIDDFKNELAEVAKVPVGDVRLGIIDNLVGNPEFHVAESIADLQRELPGAGISFFVAPPSELEHEVLNRTVDMAIGIFSQRHPTLRYVTLFQEEHVLYCARDHEVYALAAETPDISLLATASYVSWSYLESYVTSHFPLQLNTQFASPYIDGVACLILSGRAIGYLPRSYAEQWVSRGLLRAIWPDVLSRRVDIVLTKREARDLTRTANLLYRAIITRHKVLASA
jgi:LysR family transcriptional regulator, transcriptional activator for bauABCD operon